MNLTRSPARRIPPNFFGFGFGLAWVSVLAAYLRFAVADRSAFPRDLAEVMFGLGALPSTWSFAFAWSAVASAALHWLKDTRPAGFQAGEYLLLAANSVLVTAIAARTVAAACRGRLCD